MHTRTVRDLNIPLPGDEADELDHLERVPRDGELVADHLVTGDVWARASLSQVTLTRSWLSRADLSSSEFAAVTLDRCVLTGCTLVGARWDAVTLKNVILENCRLDYATFTGIRSAGPVGFIGCSMVELTVIGGKLTTVVLDGCKLAGLIFDGCDLRGADLRGNDLSGMSGASALRGTVLSESQLPTLTDLLTRELSIRITSDPS